MRKKYKTSLGIVLILVCMLINGCSNEDTSEAEGENDQSKITIGATPWTSTEFPSEVAKLILEDMGYEVEIKDGELGVIFSALAEDDIDMFLDYWDPQFEEYLDKYADSVEKVSTSYEGADRGLVVPTYMEDVNDVEDLKGIEDTVDNEILAIEESDPAIEAIPKLIESYDLDLEMLNSTEPAMLTAAEDKMEKKEPVVFFGWRPHSMFEMYDVKDVEDLKGIEDTVDNEILAIEESDPAIEAIPKLIESYDLDLEMLNSTEPAMLTAAEDKMEKKEPVVFFGWRPHSMFEMYDV